MSNRIRVEVEQTDRHLADDARADGAKTIASLAHSGMPDSRVTIPVGGVGKFERDERLIARPIVPAVASHDQRWGIG